MSLSCRTWALFWLVQPVDALFSRNEWGKGGDTVNSDCAAANGRDRQSAELLVNSNVTLKSGLWKETDNRLLHWNTDRSVRAHCPRVGTYGEAYGSFGGGCFSGVWREKSL